MPSDAAGLMGCDRKKFPPAKTRFPTALQLNVFNPVKKLYYPIPGEPGFFLAQGLLYYGQKGEADMLDLITEPAKQLPDEADFESLLDSLLAVLRQDVEVYRELQANIKEKRDVLIRPSLELLTESNSKAETCVLKAKMLEEVRANIIKKIAKSLDREEKDITLTFLSSCVDGQRKTELRAQQRALSSLMGSISEMNAKNKVLLDYSLSYVTNSMNFINQIRCTGADYVNTGKLKAGSRSGIMLCKEG